MSIVAEIPSASPPRQPTRMLLYGPPGAGKTSFAAYCPNVCFIMIRGETGLWTLTQSGCLPAVPHLPEPANDWPTILNYVRLLATEDHPYRCVCIDSMAFLEACLHEYTCQEDFGGNWGNFQNWQAGPRQAIRRLDPFLMELDRLRARGMSIILIAHAEPRPFRDPCGKDWDKWQPALAKETTAAVNKWADQILLLSTRPPDVKTPTKSATKGKATGTAERVIFTGLHHGYEAKNRHGLPAEIDCGDSPASAWHHFAEAMKGGAR